MFVSAGDWLTSSPPLFPSGGGLPEGPTGATMATAGCSRGHCECAPGVGGALCDRCLKDFWGFNLIGSGSSGVAGGGGALGCTRCGCNKLGSVRTDCEQATGRCVCKPGIEGLKCDTCPDGQGLSSRGCNGRE